MPLQSLLRCILAPLLPLQGIGKGKCRFRTHGAAAIQNQILDSTRLFMSLEFSSKRRRTHPIREI